MAKELKQYAKFYGLDDLIAEKFGVPLGEEDITIQRLSEKVGCTWDTARKVIKEWEAAGSVKHLGKRRAVSGKMMDAWQVIQK